jgi:hypothetical protein
MFMERPVADDPGYQARSVPAVVVRENADRGEQQAHHFQPHDSLA